jgi:threonine dehydrogenase-like Zn-dependent dehydrogenase
VPSAQLTGAIVAVAAVGLCGTDAHIFSGESPNVRLDSRRTHDGRATSGRAPSSRSAAVTPADLPSSIESLATVDQMMTSTYTIKMLLTSG